MSSLQYPEGVNNVVRGLWQGGDDLIFVRCLWCRDPIKESHGVEMAYRAQKVQKVMVQPIVSFPNA